MNTAFNGLQSLWDQIEPSITYQNFWLVLGVLALFQLVWIKIHLATIRRTLTGESPGLRLRMLARLRAIIGWEPRPNPATGLMAQRVSTRDNMRVRSRWAQNSTPMPQPGRDNPFGP